MYGKLIFIKKTGGDGSKYPVTEKNVTIGRSAECLVRILNSQIAPQHCQLIVVDSGQVRLKKLSNDTYLNGERLNVGEVALRHGDVFKVGDRLVRWEYPPTSKYYNHLLSSNGRLIAVVMPQQRSMSTSGISAASASQSAQVRRSCGSKRRYSERSISEKESSNKVLKTSGVSKINNSINSLPKLLSQRRSLHSAKFLFSPKIKRRKTVSEINGLQTPETQLLEKPASSPMPSLNNVETPPINAKGIRRQSTPFKKSVTPSGRYSKSCRQSGLLKSSKLKSIVEISPVTEYLQPGMSFRSVVESLATDESLLFITPQKKKLNGNQRLVKSERKFKSSPKNSSKKVLSPRLSLARVVDKTPNLHTIKESHGALSTNTFNSTAARKVSRIHKLDNTETPTRKTRTSPTFSKKLCNALITPTAEGEASVAPVNSSEKNSDSSSSSKKMLIRKTVRKSLKPNKSKMVGKKLSTPNKSRISMPVALKSRASNKAMTGRKRKSDSSVSRVRFDSPISSAKKAAHQLKTSSPRKPDKNKKAALLVLGKASCKQGVPQSTKVLLKKKIVKKAIKQSAAPVRKNLMLTKLPTENSRTRTKKSGIIKKGKSDTKSKVKISPKPTKVQLSLDGTSNSELLAKKTENESSSTSMQIHEKSSSKKGVTGNSKNSLFTSGVISSPKFFPKESKTTSSFIFSTGRRSSKRLSSKNDVVRPDFMELSPTALGLIPKNVEIFKTPREKKRKSSSLTTPNNNWNSGIIKSASTSKIFNRKSVRFSSKDFSIGPDYSHDVTIEGKPFHFDNIRTPNISLDVFVSPLTTSPAEASQTKLDKSAGLMGKYLKTLRSDGKGSKCARKILVSPQSLHKLKKSVSEIKRPNERQSKKNFTKAIKALDMSKESATLKKNLTDIGGIEQLFATPTKETMLSASKAHTKLDSIGRNVEEFNRSGKKQVSLINGKKEDAKAERNKFSTPRKSKISPSSKNITLKSPRKSPSKAVKSLDLQNYIKNSPEKNKSLRLSRSPGIDKIERDVKPESSSPKKALVDGPTIGNVKSGLSNKQIVGTERTPSKESSLRKSVKAKETNVGKSRRSTPIQKSPKNASTSVKSVRKLLAPPKVQKSPKNNLSNLRGVRKLLKTPKAQKSPKNDLSDLRGVRKLMGTPKVQKSPKNDLSDVKGVRKLLRTPKVQKSPKNDLSDVKGVRKLLRTPKVQKSPKNDLSDLRGVRKLMTTPKVQKSPKNDLSDLRGVRKLMTTPKVQKSPKNDLSDVRGVRKLLGTPKVQKSPKNDLSDVRGVRKLMTTPKVQKSPKNDLSDVKGVRKLMATPKVQKSPKNDLSDVRGVRKLLGTPKVQKSPKNDLSDVRGVRKLMTTPKVQKSPKNDLCDVRGVRKLLGTPKVQKSPKNDLSDVRGVRKLLGTPKVQKSPKNDLSDVRGVRKLLGTPKVQKSPKNDLSDVRGVRKLLTTPRIQKNHSKQLLKSPKVEKPPKNDLSDVGGIRRLMATPRIQKGPKNDLTNVEGIQELFNLPEIVDELRNAGESCKAKRRRVNEPVTPKKIRGKKIIRSPSNELENNLKEVKVARKPPSEKKESNRRNNVNVGLTGLSDLDEESKKSTAVESKITKIKPLRRNATRKTITRKAVTKPEETKSSTKKVTQNSAKVKEIKAMKRKSSEQLEAPASKKASTINDVPRQRRGKRKLVEEQEVLEPPAKIVRAKSGARSEFSISSPKRARKPADAAKEMPKTSRAKSTSRVAAKKKSAEKTEKATTKKPGGKPASVKLTSRAKGSNISRKVSGASKAKKESSRISKTQKKASRRGKNEDAATPPKISPRKTRSGAARKLK